VGDLFSHILFEREEMTKNTALKNIKELEKFAQNGLPASITAEMMEKLKELEYLATNGRPKAITAGMVFKQSEGGVYVTIPHRRGIRLMCVFGDRNGSPGELWTPDSLFGHSEATFTYLGTAPEALQERVIDGAK
jgi:hypothetical protein